MTPFHQFSVLFFSRLYKLRRIQFDKLPKFFIRTKLDMGMILIITIPSIQNNLFKDKQAT